MVAAERPRGGDVDEHADERERIRMNPQRDAGGDDGPQREHADGPHEPCKRHVLL
jgi:hypothetical protein